MAEYISREFMLENLKTDKMNNAEHCEPATIQIMDRFIRYVSEFPSADVQPVKHGKWEYIRKVKLSGTIKLCECNICHNKIFGGLSYCSNCGARMDGDIECQ